VHYLLQQRTIQISAGLGDLKSTIFRIGHMSPMTTREDITLLSDALMELKKKSSFK